MPRRVWVTGEYVQDWTDIRTGHAYIILTRDEGIVFKVVENMLEKERKLMLFSLNPLYEPYELGASQVVEAWKFVHYISNELPDPALPEDHLMSMVLKLKQDINRLKQK